MNAWKIEEQNRLSASEEKGKEDATSLLSTEEYKAGHPLRNFDFSLKC